MISRVTNLNLSHQCNTPDILAAYESDRKGDLYVPYKNHLNINNSINCFIITRASNEQGNDN